MAGAAALPALPPDLPEARLPAIYAAAQIALMQCDKIDECRDWANKAEALATYARMAHNDELRFMADRIQARAVRRVGELLQEIPRQTGAHLKRDTTVPFSRNEAATEAGLSERERKTALRVANVPQEQFEEGVERNPPTRVRQLADMGTQSIPVTPFSLDRDAAIRLGALLGHCVEVMPKIDVEAAKRGMTGDERARFGARVTRILYWMGALDV